MNMNGLETTIMRHIYANMTYPYTEMNINFYANERDSNALNTIQVGIRKQDYTVCYHIKNQINKINSTPMKLLIDRFSYLKSLPNI